MRRHQTLKDHLDCEVDGGKTTQAIAAVVNAVTSATKTISALVRAGRLEGELGSARGDNADGDVQKELDIVANEILVRVLANAPIACLVSEELADLLVIDTSAPLIVAIDPLDGSSNIDTNTAVGTIFSLWPADIDSATPLETAALQQGSRQVAAGYVIYGPQTALVLTTGNGTHIFTLDPESGEFLLTQYNMRVADTTREFAINVSNFRHWDRPIRTYIDDCLHGTDGNRGSNYNMRWLASLVAECHRIFSRGGVFLYPSDAREGYGAGRLRLLYEVNPIAYLIEQAGGAATTGTTRVLEITPTNIHQRAPMMFGSQREIARIERYFSDADLMGNHSQLFNKRGLFRA